MKKSVFSNRVFTLVITILSISILFSCSEAEDEAINTSTLKFNVATADGYAAGTTGGAGGSAISVSTAAAFKTAATSSARSIITVSGNLNVGEVRVTSNKTIIGANASATLNGNLLLKGVTNIIIQNLNITNPSGVGSSDGMEITNASTKIFVTKCTFTDCKDGELDIKRQSTNITVSWCRFRYVNQTSHNFANLIGHSDSFTGDRGFLRVTMHHNWYDNGCKERMPRVRFGQVHCYNNFYGAAGANYCVGLGDESQVLLQNCYFENQGMPWKDYSSSSSKRGRIQWSGNTFVGSPIPTWAPNSTVFNPPYSYSLASGSAVKTMVVAGAGNR
jgi:pectate lyase